MTTKPIQVLLIIVFTYLLITGWNINIQTIANPDEPRYAVASREMLRGGDVIVPQFNDSPRLAKPILFYWLIAATGEIGKRLGLDLPTAMRLGPLLMGLFTALGLYRLSIKVMNIRVGLFAAMILITTRLFHETSRQLIVDMTLSAALTWTWVFAITTIERLEKKQSSRLSLFGFYTCIGLASMTKGPFLPLLFVLIPLFAYLLWTRRINLLLRWGIWWGIPYSIALGFWWFAVIHLRGQDIWGLDPNHVGRVLAVKGHFRPIPYLHYLAKLGEDFAPWVVIIPFVIASIAKPPRGFSNEAKFVVCSAALPFLVLGALPTKRGLYLLPIYPLLSIWIAYVWDQWLVRTDRIPSKLLTKVSIVVGLLFLVAATTGLFILKSRILESAELASLIFSAIVVVSCFLLIAKYMLIGNRHAASLTILLIAVTITLGYEAVVRPVNERAENRIQFYDALKGHLRGRKLVILGTTANEAVWYLDRREKIARISRADLSESLFTGNQVALLTPKKVLDAELQKLLPVEAELVLDGEQFILSTPNIPPNYVPTRKNTRDTEPSDSDE